MANTDTQVAGKQGEVREADDFASLLKQSFKPRTERAATEVENAVATLVREALKGEAVIKDDVIDTIENMIARIDEKLTGLVGEKDIEAARRTLTALIQISKEMK